jgi:hypothetical protein
MRNDDLAAEVARLDYPPLERMVRAGEMELAHPMGLLVQFAGLAPSSRR